MARCSVEELLVQCKVAWEEIAQSHVTFQFSQCARKKTKVEDPLPKGSGNVIVVLDKRRHSGVTMNEEGTD